MKKYPKKITVKYHNKCFVNHKNDYDRFFLDTDTLSNWLESCKKSNHEFIEFDINVNLDQYDNIDGITNLNLISYNIEIEDDETYKARVKSEKMRDKKYKEELEKREIEQLKKLKQKYPSVEL